MRRNRLKGKPSTLAIGAVIFLACSLAMSQTGNSTSSNEPTSEWKRVENAMGRTGQIQPGDVIKFGMPRKDLHVVLNGVDIKPGLALGSWAAFKRDGAGAMVWATWFSPRTKSNL
jgi:hypothetical protein